MLTQESRAQDVDRLRFGGDFLADGTASACEQRCQKGNACGWRKGATGIACHHPRTSPPRTTGTTPRRRMSSRRVKDVRPPDQRGGMRLAALGVGLGAGRASRGDDAPLSPLLAMRAAFPSLERVPVRAAPVLAIVPWVGFNRAPLVASTSVYVEICAGSGGHGEPMGGAWGQHTSDARHRERATIARGPDIRREACWVPHASA